MTSLNDMIWKPEDENLLEPNERPMLQLCLVAFCDIYGGGCDIQIRNWGCGTIIEINRNYKCG